MIALELVAIASTVMTAYYHVGQLSEDFFIASVVTILVLGLVGALFRNRIDLEGSIWS
jgi:sorbitol-specific phosphotransferase system component IIC